MAKRTDLTGAALFRETTLDQWHALLQEYDNTNIEIQPDKAQIKVACLHPDHTDSTPSSYINVAFGNYHCWSCANETVFDPIGVVALIADCDYGDAFGIFSDHFDMRPTRGNIETARAQSQEDRQFMRDMVGFTRYCLQEIYANPTNFPESYQRAVRWLKKRKVTEEDLAHFSIGILVGGDLMNSMAPQWFFKTKQPMTKSGEFLKNYQFYYGKVNTPSNYGALLFPHFVTPTQVGRVQIRVDFLSDMAGGLKFYFVTPGDQAPEHIKRLFEGPTGFFGLDTWGRVARRGAGFAVAMTEGATDTLATSKAQMDKFGHTTLPAIAVPGTGAKELDRLVSYGIHEVRFIGDHPSEHGDDVVSNYLQQSKMLDIMPLRWPEGVDAKDISQLYIEEGADAVCSLVLADDHYEMAHEHVLRRLRETIAKEGAGPERVNKLIEERVNRLGSPAAQRSLVAVAAQEFTGISEKALTTKIAIDEDTADGFKLRIRQDIEEHFEFYYKQMDGEDQKILVGYRSRANNKKFLHTGTGTSILETVCEPFGARTEWAFQCRIPDNLRFRKKGKKKEPLPPTIIRREMTTCIREVLEDIIREIPFSYDKFEDLSNGIHQVQHDGQEKMLVVNGDDRYLGTFSGSADNPQLVWEVYFPEKVIEKGKQKPRWTDNIDSEADLWDGNKSDLKQLWHDIYNTIDAGWRFTRQEEDVTWLTGLAIYSAIYDFSNRTLLTVITGEKESGKSRLVKEFFGGKRPIGSKMPQTEFYSYLEFPSTSEAGIRQEFAGASGIQRRGLVLDEFENDGPKSKYKMDAIFGTLRGMLDGSALVKKGTKGGRSLSYDLRFPTLLAGIMEFTDATGAVESRVYRVETKREQGRSSPMRSVAAAHPHIDGDDVTRRLTVGVLRFAQQARVEADRLLHRINYEDFVTNKMLVASSDRPNVSAATIGGIMAICGFSDAQIERRLAMILTKMNADQAERIEVPGQRIWNDLLSMIVALPEHDDESEMDIFAGHRQTLNRVSLHDALFDPQLRRYIGKKDFFQAFRIYEGEYMLIDRYYLRDYLKREDIGWTEFCTRLGREFDTLSQDKTRLMARKHGDVKYAQSTKKLICIKLPDEIVNVWDEDTEDDPPDSPSTPSAPPGIPGAPSGTPAPTPAALANGPGIGPPSGYKGTPQGGTDGLDRGNSSGSDTGPAPSHLSPPTGAGGTASPGGALLRGVGSTIPPDGREGGGVDPHVRETPGDGGNPLVAGNGGGGDTGPDR